LQLQWQGLALMYETKTFLSSLSWVSILSLFYPSRQQSRMPEECSKNVNLTSRIRKQLGVSSCFTTPKTEKVCQGLRKGMISQCRFTLPRSGKIFCTICIKEV
jgi:hypothetical protein